ncbi:MAG: O-acetylhomoserine aminocarboxypropyltransferase/cysteine synthase [Planctomycetaceae bacterium]|nr:O-acetylhomoserine aminocarboxypropyltransferase/cysteine synthase [Planctomycetaceae bacterium]
MKPNTLAIHAGQTPDPTTGSCAVPIHLTTSFAYKDVEYARTLFTLETAGHIYTRLSNPTTSVFEDRMTALDGGVGAVAFSSGQQAILVALLNLAQCGEHIVASRGLYGGTVSLFLNTFKKFGIEVSLVDMSNPDNIAKAVKQNTRAVFYEVLANPKNEVLDYPKIAEAAHAHGLPVIADNTVLTPVLFRPFDFGVDIAVYSATKMIGGHGTVLGGVLVDGGRFDWGREPKRWPQFTEPDPQYHGVNFYERFGKACYIVTCRANWLRDLGGCISPMNSFQLLQGLETLPLRAPKHSENALAVAKHLESHPKVAWVNYPGLASHPNYALAQKYLPKGSGSILGFGIKGDGRAAGQKFIESVKLATHLANICDARTLVIHPATTTHSQLSDEELLGSGVSPDFIRMSVGLEDVEDIVADIEQALG